MNLLYPLYVKIKSIKASNFCSKKTKLLLLNVVLFLVSLPLLAQTDTLIDQRDGKKYEIVKIDSLWWITQNLRFETEDAYFPNFNKKKEQLKNGNFYTNNRIEKICPKGWRIPTGEEWAKAVAKIFKTDKIIKHQVKLNNSTIFNFEKPDSINFKQSNILNIKRYGWVQGNKFNYNGGTTFWLAYPKDPNAHIHFDLDGFSQHTHEHHIKDKPKRKRKFLVRCVCEDEMKVSNE